MADVDAAFWGAVAQVTPVLALALVLDLRTLARKATSKNNELPPKVRRSLNRARALYAFGSLASGVILGTMFVTALQVLGGMRETTIGGRGVALWLLLATFAFIVIYPISETIARFGVWTFLAQRRLDQIRLQTLARYDARLVSNALRERGQLADEYVEAYREFRFRDDRSNGGTRRAEKQLEEAVTALDARREEFDRRRAHQREHIATLSDPDIDAEHSEKVRRFLRDGVV